MVENSRVMGERLRDNLRNIQSSDVSKGLIGDVRGLGLMTGLEFTKKADPGVKSKISQAALDEGLLLLGCSTYEVIRFAPALNIKAEDIDKGSEMLENALKSI